MIIREHYMAQIRPFYESDLVKIITGIRRCGKSVILRQVLNELEAIGKRCLFLDFDLRPVRTKIPNADALISYVNDYLGEDKLYVFLDEVQNVEGWNEAGRTLRLYNTSVFITGSNSKLLSREFTKELSGRYVSFRIRPFVYREAKEYVGQLGRSFEVSDYLVWGGFPAALEQQNKESMKRYLNDLNNTIIYNDLENRYNIRKKDVFEHIVDYILVSNARIFSAKSIADYMKGQNISVSVPTVIKYLGYLKEAYVIEDIPLYSPKAKAKLNYYYKLYDEDVSLNSIRVSGNRYDLTHNLENIVLNELIYLGYEVTVYNNKGREIDFRASRDGKLYLIQVAYSVAEEKTYEREFSAFANIDNTVKKIIITNDDIDYSTSTVYHYKLRDFLLMNKL
ncbi:ATP-binding protein [Porcincola intestinalis]|uniref:ATP-binding protein n=1 Tax=Porcincola intestinalis TaxID=2606632 RepID=UPI002A7F06C1|nr:ATP-binding protein [Porcincola intestinalis]MDY4204232.1 ATP-binding protein [Porcincola intestinalis]